VYIGKQYSHPGAERLAYSIEMKRTRATQTGVPLRFEEDERRFASREERLPIGTSAPSYRLSLDQSRSTRFMHTLKAASKMLSILKGATYFLL
jgi:hypothetical protein